MEQVPAQFTEVSFFNSDAGVIARSALLRAHHEQQVTAQVLSPSTMLNDDDIVEEEDATVNLSPSESTVHYQAKHRTTMV